MHRNLQYDTKISPGVPFSSEINLHVISGKVIIQITQYFKVINSHLNLERRD